MEIVPSPLTVDSFAPHVGEVFMLHLADGSSIEVKLIEAEAYELHRRDGRVKGKSGNVRRDPFALLFAYEQMLAQGIYNMSHPVMGELSISLVPVGPVSEGFGHEAVFN